MHLVTRTVTFSESPGASSKARFGRHSWRYDKKVPRCCRRLASRPEGAIETARCGVAVLDKVTYIGCELRLAANDFDGSEHYSTSDEVHQC